MKHKITSFLTAIIGLVFTFFYWSESFFWPGIATLLVVYICFLVVGSIFIRFNFFLNSVNNLNSDGVSLTFDDGPDPITTPKILEILNQYNVKASFFLIGSKVQKYPEIVRRIHDEGHSIGNHSFSHSNFLPFKPDYFLKRDILKCNKLLTEITGGEIKLFRPPFGVTNPNYRRVLRKLNLKSVGWSVRSMDTTANSKQIVLDKVIPALKNRDVVLLHDTQKTTLEALPNIIQYCQNNGMALVALDL